VVTVVLKIDLAFNSLNVTKLSLE